MRRCVSDRISAGLDTLSWARRRRARPQSRVSAGEPLDLMRVTYISWAPHCSRSDHTARELGGTSHMVYWGWLGSHPATIAFKYLGQTVVTWRLLAREHPDVVFVMSPPPIAVMAAFIYCALRRVPFVVDIHTGAFWQRWRLFHGVQFWLCRRALTTIVHNEHHAELVRANGGHATVVPD